MIKSMFTALFACAALMVVGGCNQETPTTKGGDAPPGIQVKEVRFSLLPDSNKDKENARYTALENYFSKKVGIPFKRAVVADYKAVVTGMAQNSIELAWYGGVTGVQIIDSAKESGLDVEVMACRAEDLKFKSYLVANKKAVDEGRIPASIKDLSELKGKTSAISMTFGPKLSTSGRVMPWHFMSNAGIDPSKDFKSLNYSTGHDNTIQLVNDGTWDLGVMNYTNYESSKTKDNTVHIFTTPEYVDYVWVARKNIGAELLQKIKDAFAAMDANDADGKAVIEAFGPMSKWTVTDGKPWNPIRDVLKDLKAKKLID